MSRLVVVGKEAFTLRHLKVFRREELAAIFGELAPVLEKKLESVVVLLTPLYVRAGICGRELLLSPGVTHVRGAALKLAGALQVPPLLDADFLEYLLFDLPRALEEERRAVVVEDLDGRFTVHAEEGVSYSLDILARVASVYRVPVVVYGSELSERWGYFSRRVRCEKLEGRELCTVDGEPVCG